MPDPNYPWFAAVDGDDLVQGDILELCRIFRPPAELADTDTVAPIFDYEDRDVIVITQTCDLVKGREKVTEVVLCPIWKLSHYSAGILASPKGREEVRRGNLPGYHMLAPCELTEFRRETRVVDFRQLFSLPLLFIRRQATSAGRRIRLLPPYREHLAQAFARYFMRVGLPIDIPAFK